MKTTSRPTAPPEPTATIAVGYSRVMARQLGLNEKSMGVLLDGSGLTLEALMDDNTLLTKNQQLQITRNAIAYSGTPAFGLELGRALTPPTHGPLGFLANSSPDLATAIKDFQSFIPGRINIIRSQTEYRRGNLDYYFAVDIEDAPALSRCVSEAFFLSLISLIESVAGEKFSAGEMHCAYAKPAYHDEYAKHIHCPITFGCSANKLVVPEGLLRTVNVSSDHQSYKFALEQCRKMLEDLDAQANSMTRRVRRQLLSHPPGKLREEDTAQLNFISKRTLARRLEAEDTSFRELKEQLQLSLATDYLRDTKLSVEAVAALLNYHDSSSFRRAFRRWMQMTPQQFREREL